MDAIRSEIVGSLKGGTAFEWSVQRSVLYNISKRSDVFTLTHIPDFQFFLTCTWQVYDSYNFHLNRVRGVKCGLNTSTRNAHNSGLPMDVRFILHMSNTVYKSSAVMKMESNRITANFSIDPSIENVKVQCVVIYSDSSLQQSDVIVCQQANPPKEFKHGLAHGLSSLLNNSNFWDITLCVQGKEFKAHRCILAARSTVFSAMFDHDLKEKLENRIVIADIDSDVIQELLKYVYTDEIGESTPQQYLDLFAAADKYDMVGLRKKCAHFLKKKLSLDCLVSILIVADLHHENDLKEAAIQLFLKDPLSIMNSDEWLSCMKIHTQMANSVLLRLAKK